MPYAVSARTTAVVALAMLAGACSDARSCGSPLMPSCEPAAIQPLAEPHLVFQSNHEGSFQIYTMNSDGSGLARLTSGSGVSIRPRWSPDGREIVFVSTRDGAADIFVMDADGGNQRNLTQHTAVDGFPDWSPDGRYIVFHSLRDEGSPEIFVMDRDGSSVRQITKHPSFNVQPRWSPDGAQIAFVTDRAGFGQVYVMNPDGSGQRPLTHEGSNQMPAWSPAGRHIVFEAMRAADMIGSAGLWQIYLMPAGGRQHMNVSRSGAHDTRPTWSRTGHIYFVSVRTGQRELWVMNPDGSDQRQITAFGANVESPDAK
jgi:TolB protein